MAGGGRKGIKTRRLEEVRSGRKPSQSEERAAPPAEAVSPPAQGSDGPEEILAPR